MHTMLSETPKRAGRNSARPRHAARPSAQPLGPGDSSTYEPKVDVYVAPSTLHVPLVKDDLKALGIGVATQNCNFAGCGAYPDIDGFLVGGASLKPEICEIVKEIAVAKNTFAMGGA